MTAQARHLTVRNLPPAVARALQTERRRRGKSLNQVVIDILATALGTAEDSHRSNGLEKLAGGWTEKQADHFDDAVACFEEIDQELWR
jgi:plasmid stability protein